MDFEINMSSVTNSSPVRVGRCKWMRGAKGYGFISDLESKEEIFVHYSALKRSSHGYRCLFPNEYIEYQVAYAGDRKIATAVTGIQGGPLLCEVQTDPSRASHKYYKSSYKWWAKSADQNTWKQELTE